MLRVEIQVDQELPAESSDAERQLNQRITKGLDTLRLMAGVARDFVMNYISLVRSKEGQYWLGPSTLTPRVRWLSQLLDHDGSQIPVGYNDPFVVSYRSVDTALSKENHSQLLDQAAQGVHPGLAEIFLSDAKLAASQPENPDLRQAVLLAAIACEVKVKEALMAVASPAQESLVNLLLENPRDWSMAAASLFDKAMDAICGRSLRTENRVLHKDISLLYENRNRIAHRGGTGLSTDDVLRGHITSADQAFDWLNDIIATGQAGEESNSTTGEEADTVD
jgi:hypothetical protein